MSSISLPSPPHLSGGVNKAHTSLSVTQRGRALLDNPLLNKGLAFSLDERTAFGLEALLPPAIQTLDQQVQAAYDRVMAQQGILARHCALRAIQEENETVFYALLARNLRQFMPLVYTPGVGEGCLHFSQTWCRPRGLFLSARQAGHIAAHLAENTPDSVRLIIITDGERILGLGDLGANGMGIPIGKLSLYTACAGIDPALMLPVTLDIGTDNEELLNDPGYIGVRHKRLRGAAYEAFIEEVVTAFKARWPDILLHWEDFAGRNAAPLLTRYRHHILSFNDDIQGTAAIATAALLAALSAKGASLHSQRIAVFGGGAAGCGIATQLLAAIKAEKPDLTDEEARNCFYLFDRPGLLSADMANLTAGQAIFARRDYTEHENGRDLLSVVQAVHPTILIGVSGQAGLFTKEIITSMAAHCERPLIFPLSNPTSHVEATPEDILHWTNGRALVSTGSPFPPVTIHGRDITVDQTNNAYIFPGLGLGVLACKAREISDAMLMKAAMAVAALSPLKQDHPEGKEAKTLLPPLEAMPHVARAVARAVAFQAREENLCPDFGSEALDAALEALHWEPTYRPYHHLPA